MNFFDVIPFTVPVFLIICIILIIMMARSHSFNVLKFYFLVISIVGVIGSVSGLGTAIYQGIMKVMITDQEYITSNNAWEISQCEDPYYRPKTPVVNGQNPPAKTDAEIKSCKEEATTKVLQRRSYDHKYNIITGSVWGILFLILFLSHFPLLLKTSKQED